LDFVREIVAAQALDHLPELPDLPDFPEQGGGHGEGNLPAIQFPEPALDAFANLPQQAHLPDWFL
jgi:hypothetical protein